MLHLMLQFVDVLIQSYSGRLFGLKLLELSIVYFLRNREQDNEKRLTLLYILHWNP